MYESARMLLLKLGFSLKVSLCPGEMEKMQTEFPQGGILTKWNVGGGGGGACGCVQEMYRGVRVRVWNSRIYDGLP